MAEPKSLRPIAAPFVAAGAAIRDRINGLSFEDERVLRLVGEHLGRLAAWDLKARCPASVNHDAAVWV